MYPWLDFIFKDLQTRLARSSLHHALLLSASVGSGESELAHALAKRLLCQTKQAQSACSSCKACSLFEAGSHPDFHPVVSEKSQIGVDAVRQAIEKVTKTAQLSANKVVLIEQVERMSESASNALLKTLEEPTADTYLILTTNAPQYILATIKSRCEKISVPLPSYEQSQQFFQECDQACPSQEELAAYHHSPLIYLSERSAEGLDFKGFKQDFELLTSGMFSAEQAANKWKDMASEACAWAAQISLKALSKEIEKDVDQTSHVAGTQWMMVYDKAILAGKKLRQAGLNKTLILSALFSELSNIH